MVIEANIKDKKLEARFKMLLNKMKSYYKLIFIDKRSISECYGWE